MLQIIELKVVLLEQYSKLLMSVSLLVCEVFTFIKTIISNVLLFSKIVSQSGR